MTKVRSLFPILTSHPELVYLDSANTTLKSDLLLKALAKYYHHHLTNVGRSGTDWSTWVTRQYQLAHQDAGELVGAKSDNIIFTYSSTYAINMVRYGIQHTLHPGDIILLTLHEHNSNLLPWLALAKQTGAQVKYMEELPLSDLPMVKLFSYSLVSNLTGEVYDYHNLTTQIRKQGGLILVDATQAVPHLDVSIDRLNCDFLVYSAHKVYGMTGLGVLYIADDQLQSLIPMVYGSQTFSYIDRSDYKLLSSTERFEPGTPNIEGALGLRVGLQLLRAFRHREEALGEYFLDQLRQHRLDRFLIGPANPDTRRIPIFSLAHPTVHPHDIAMLLESQQIIVRAGKSCADIPAQHLGEARGVIRASLGIYNTQQDIDRFITGYKQAINRLGG